MSTSPRRPLALFVINSLAGGGAERMMTELLAASEPYRVSHDIALVLLDDETEAYQVPGWVAVHRLDCGFSLARSFTRFLALARRLRPAVTLSFLSRANFVTVAAARLLGHRAVISERVNTSGHFASGLSSRVSRLLVRAFYPRADRVIAVSQGISDDLADNFGVSHQRLAAISNPVNAARIEAAAREPAEPLVAGSYAIAISRLSRNKNAILTIEALAASGTDLSLLILGQGPEREAMQARAAELGVADRVVMPGFVANPYPHLARAACYMSGSNAEGFPNGLVEALALGVPAISTNCPSGPSEILADLPREAVTGPLDAPYGMLVPQNDAQAMGAALRRMLEPATEEKYRAAGRRRAADYGVEQARDRYWGVLLDALGDTKGR